MNITEIDLGGQRMYVCDSSSDEERALIGKDAPHSHYAIRRHEIHAELAAFQKVAEKVGKVGRVVELFGGSGWHASIIQQLCKPRAHLALDIEKDCVMSIKRSLPDVNARVTDSYAFIGEQPKRYWDWVHADFNQLTFNRFLTEKRYMDAVDAIFKASKKWVTITDSAIFGLSRFPKNRASYHKSIGMHPDHWPDYFRVVARKYKERYDFGTLMVVTWHRMSSMFLLQRGAPQGALEIEEVQDKVPVKVVREFKEIVR